MAGRTALALFATALLVLGCSSEASTPSTPRKHQIAIIGDSFTEGTDEGGVGPLSWPAVLQNRLQAEGTTVDLNVSAEGSAGYAQPGYNQDFFSDKAAVVSDRDDMVIFFGGVNDGNVDPVGLATAVHDTFAATKARAPKAKFIVIGPAWPTDDPPAEVLAVRDVIRDQAAEAGLEFVDPLEEKWLVGAPDLTGADGLHPTDLGHAYLADRIAPLVEKAYDDH